MTQQNKTHDRTNEHHQYNLLTNQGSASHAMHTFYIHYLQATILPLVQLHNSF